MSQFRNTGVRCDWCGKFSMHERGEYMKPDGSCGYINQPQWEVNHYNAAGEHAPISSDSDICEECESGKCINCGGDQLVRITPSTPGPTGWGWRCKTCRHRWDIPTPTVEAS